MKRNKKKAIEPKPCFEEYLHFARLSETQFMQANLTGD